MRFAGGLITTGASGIAPVITMPPRTFGAISVRNAASSLSVGATGGTMYSTCPLTVPLVDGAHGSVSNLTLAFTGDVMNPVARPGIQPIPRQVNGSRCAFFIPQLVIVFTAQSAAAL